MADEDPSVVAERVRVQALYDAAFPGGVDVDGDGLSVVPTGALLPLCVCACVSV